jgi:hypothetical protein
VRRTRTAHARRMPSSDEQLISCILLYNSFDILALMTCTYENSVCRPPPHSSRRLTRRPFTLYASPACGSFDGLQAYSLVYHMHSHLKHHLPCAHRSLASDVSPRSTHAPSSPHRHRPMHAHANHAHISYNPYPIKAHFCKRLMHAADAVATAASMEVHGAMCVLQ